MIFAARLLEEKFMEQKQDHQARNQGGAFTPPEIFKALHSNFDIFAETFEE